MPCPTQRRLLSGKNWPVSACLLVVAGRLGRQEPGRAGEGLQGGSRRHRQESPSHPALNLASSRAEGASGITLSLCMGMWSRGRGSDVSGVTLLGCEGPGGARVLEAPASV